MAMMAAVQHELNSIDPVDLVSCADRISGLGIHDATMMASVVSCILQHALQGPVTMDEESVPIKNSVYGDSLADLMFNLRMRFPQFPNQEDPTATPVTFTRLLLSEVQG